MRVCMKCGIEIPKGKSCYKDLCKRCYWNNWNAKNKAALIEYKAMKAKEEELKKIADTISTSGT